MNQSTAPKPTLEETIKDLNAQNEAFFKEAFTDPLTRAPYQIPEDLKRLARRLCQSYGIRGVCDPMYIANVIAFELGLGDGRSHFHHRD